MTGISGILKDLEGVISPENLKVLAAKFEEELKSKEQEFISAAEQKYGVPPAVVSDIEQTVKDAAPAVADKVESLLPPEIVALIKSQAAQLDALQTQINSLKSQNAANQTTVVMGQGEPVLHNLFLDDGSVVKNHPGLATHYSVDVPATATSDATSVVRTVVAAYPA
jgi:hypothetical protein